MQRARVCFAGLLEGVVFLNDTPYDVYERERVMQWRRKHRALAILLLCTTVIALRLLWPPLDYWLVRLLLVLLFTDHLPEVIKYFEGSR